MAKTRTHLELVKQSVQFIENQLTQPINVKTVAEQSGLSSWQFQRVFRSLIGDSIGNYLRQRRLTLAAQDLAESEKRIIDIAIEYQFGSQEAFTRSFRSQFGMPPKSFRQNPIKFSPYQRAELNSETIEHICHGIQREPEIVQMGPIKLIGIQTVIQSPLSRDPDFLQKAPALWSQFNPMKKQIPNRVGKKSYGVALTDGLAMEEESMIYFAGVEVEDHQNIPDGMIALDLPAKVYATFENQGLVEKTQPTIDYVYGVWLSSAKFQRAEGYDFEVFDHRYKIGTEESLSRYCLPVDPVQ